MHTKKIATLLGAAALALAGCGGSTVDGKAAGDPLVTIKAPPPSHSSAPGTPTSTAGGGRGDDGPLTPTGTTLSVGQTATVKYAVKDLSKESTRLDVTAVSVKKGSIKD